MFVYSIIFEQRQLQMFSMKLLTGRLLCSTQFWYESLLKDRYGKWEIT